MITLVMAQHKRLQSIQIKTIAVFEYTDVKEWYYTHASRKLE